MSGAEPDRIVFGVDLASDHGAIVVCGASDSDEVRLVQAKLYEAGHAIFLANDFDCRGDLIESMWVRERHPEVYVCEAPPRLSDCLKARDPDFKPLRNRLLPRRVLVPVSPKDRAAVAAARDRQARRNAKRVKTPNP